MAVILPPGAQPEPEAAPAGALPPIGAALLALAPALASARAQATQVEAVGERLAQQALAADPTPDQPPPTGGPGDLDRLMAEARARHAAALAQAATLFAGLGFIDARAAAADPAAAVDAALANATAAAQAYDPAPAAPPRPPPPADPLAALAVETDAARQRLAQAQAAHDALVQRFGLDAAAIERGLDAAHAATPPPPPPVAPPGSPLAQLQASSAALQGTVQKMLAALPKA